MLEGINVQVKNMLGGIIVKDKASAAAGTSAKLKTLDGCELALVSGGAISRRAVNAGGRPSPSPAPSGNSWKRGCTGYRC